MLSYQAFNLFSDRSIRILKTSFLLLIFFIAADKLTAQKIYLVDATRIVNDSARGITVVSKTNWDSACNNLQTAIDSAAAGDQIWVRAGTYFPTKDTSGNIRVTTNKELLTFNIKKGIALFGGFSGSEVRKEQRNLSTNITILNGNLGGSLHVYNVVNLNYSNQNTILDGFTITGGNAGNGNNNGGGIFCDSSLAIISNCTITGNSATFKGGGLYNRNSSPTVVNSIFVMNTAALGGAVYNDNSSPLIINCTMVSNNSISNGAGVFNESPSSPVITNCIIWGNTSQNNTSDNIYTSDGLSLTGVSYSLVGQSGKYPGTNNINNNPLLVDGANGNVRQLPGSPVIDGGKNSAYLTAISSTDIGGSPRISGIVDMGAYEQTGVPLVNNSNIIYIDSSNNTITGNGTSWAKSFTSLADALNILNASPAVFKGTGTQVWITKGTYLPTSDITGKSNLVNPSDLTFNIKNGIKLYGGFNGTESSINQRNILINKAILSGNLKYLYDGARVFNVVSLVTSGDVCTLDGLTITGGSANFVHGGGGIFAQGSSSVIVNCNIINNFNSAVYSYYANLNIESCYFSGNDGYSGGGITNLFGTGTINNCSFIKNIMGSVYGTGAAISNIASSPSITNCNFIGNVARYAGGAINNANESSPNIFNCKFISNGSFPQGRGGAIANEGKCVPKIINCIFSNNGAETGGAIALGGGAPQYIINCSISNNKAYHQGGIGSFFDNDPVNPVFISNSIIWGNHATDNVREDNIFNSVERNAFANYQINNSIIGNYKSAGQPSSPYPGVNNLDADPRFIDTATGDLRLQQVSPAINAGNNESYTGNLQTDKDLAGASRLTGSIIDIGAYEIGNSILPITLVDFFGVKKDNNNYLSWHTSNQMNVEIFLLQRSANGRDFLTIQQFPPTINPGVNLTEYTYTDIDRPMTFYYRLQTVDIDGSSHYSNIILITASGKKEFSLSIISNPVTTTATYIIKGSWDTNYEIFLFDMSGKIISKTGRIAGNMIHQMDMTKLKPGNYLLQCVDNISGEKLVRKLVKN